MDRKDSFLPYQLCLYWLPISAAVMCTLPSVPGREAEGRRDDSKREVRREGRQDDNKREVGQEGEK